MALKKAAEEKKVNTLAVKETPIKNILKESVGVLINFADKAETEKKLKLIVKSNTKRVNELLAKEELTKPEFEELKKLRAVFRDPRYEMQNIEKHNTGVLNAAKTTNKLMIGEFIAILQPTEDKLHEKVLAEENKIELAKQKELEDERLRVEGLEEKLAEAKKFFEEELENARKSGDWQNYDAYMELFETNIEDLDELEFEGTELIEKYAKRKEEIIELEKTAAEQAKVAEDQKAQADKLKLEQDKLAENKRRFKEFAGIGFIYNGESFSKGESSYNEEDVEAMEPEEFDEIIKIWKDQEEEAENLKKEKEERIEKYNELIVEAKELSIDTDGEVITDGEDVPQCLIDGLEFKIAEAKTEAGLKAKKEKEEKEAEEAKVLKEIGFNVCNSVNENINKMLTDVSKLQIENLEVVNAFNRFVQMVDVEFMALKERLKQNDESI